MMAKKKYDEGVWIEPCPVCNREPDVKFSHLPTQIRCRIRCKPLFRKTHLEVTKCCAGEESELRAMSLAAGEWNAKAMYKRVEESVLRKA